MATVDGVARRTVPSSFLCLKLGPQFVEGDRVRISVFGELQEDGWEEVTKLLDDGRVRKEHAAARPVRQVFTLAISTNHADGQTICAGQVSYDQILGKPFGVYGWSYDGETDGRDRASCDIAQVHAVGETRSVAEIEKVSSTSDSVEVPESLLLVHWAGDIFTKFAVFRQIHDVPGRAGTADTDNHRAVLIGAVL
jgi:hypothetical protein